jgi:hypothetical protein
MISLPSPFQVGSRGASAGELILRHSHAGNSCGACGLLSICSKVV